MEDHLNPPPSKPKKRLGGRPRKYPRDWTETQKNAHRRQQLREAEKLAMEYAKMKVRARVKDERAVALDDFVNMKATEKEACSIDFDSADVCAYVAKVLFSCEMSYLEAAKRIRPKEDWAELAVEMKMNKNLSLAVEHLFKSIGIDETSRNQFVKTIWSWFYSDNDEKALQASRVLAKIFFADGGQPESLDVLKIEGLEEGLKRMMSTPAPATPAEPPTEEPIETNAYVMLEGRHE